MPLCLGSESCYSNETTFSGRLYTTWSCTLSSKVIIENSSISREK